MTTFKAIAIAATLTLTPSLALAMGCSGNKHEQQAQSCATGSSWDAASQTCKPLASS